MPRFERRWLENVLRDLGKMPGVELTQLRDGIPDYLRAIAATLRVGPPSTLGTRSHSAWSRVARHHGITRVRMGSTPVSWCTSSSCCGA